MRVAGVRAQHPAPRLALRGVSSASTTVKRLARTGSWFFPISFCACACRSQIIAAGKISHAALPPCVPACLRACVSPPFPCPHALCIMHHARTSHSDSVGLTESPEQHSTLTGAHSPFSSLGPVMHCLSHICSHNPIFASHIALLHCRRWTREKKTWPELGMIQSRDSPPFTPNGSVPSMEQQMLTFLRTPDLPSFLAEEEVEGTAACALPFMSEPSHVHSVMCVSHRLSALPLRHRHPTPDLLLLCFSHPSHERDARPRAIHTHSPSLIHTGLD